MLVALTGGIGSGKTTVLQLFKEFGVPVTSADEIARDLMNNDQNIREKVIAHFGDDFVDQNGNILRNKIRQIIFASKPDRRWLEELLHPKIRQLMVNFAAQIDYPYCVVEIPLLLEAKMEDCADIILTVDCPEELQISRTMQRDGNTRFEVQSIIHSQITRKERLERSDDVIENTEDLAFLRKQVELFHQRYLEIASTPG